MVDFHEHKVPLRVQQGEVAVEARPASRRRNWTPFAIRLPFLVFIIVALQLCTVGLEILLRRSAPLPPEMLGSVQRRQVASTKVVDNSTTTAMTTTPLVSTSMTDPGAFGSLTSSSSTTASTRTITYMTAPGAYGSLTSTECYTVYVAATDVLTVTIPNAPRSLAASGCVPVTITTTDTMVNTVTRPDAFGSSTLPSPSSSYSTVAPSAAPPSRYGPLTSLSSTKSSQTGPATSAAAPSRYGSLTAESTVVVVTHTTISSISTNNGFTQVTILSTFTSTSTKTRSIDPTHTSSPDVLASLSRDNVMVQGTFRHLWYFVALYLPSILAVLIKEAWSMVGSSAKLIEPFYRLNRSGGATAAETLCSEYLASAMTWSSVKDALTGNFHLLVIILVNLVMSMLAPLATESMTVQFLGNGVDAQGHHFREDPRWFVRTPLVRATQAVLSFVSACTAIIIVCGLIRRSGLSGNPSSIASMATLLGDPDVVRDISEIDPNASISSMKKAVADRRYALVDHMDENGQDRYGLLRIGGIGFQETRRTLPRTTVVQTGPMAPQDLDEDDMGYMTRGTLPKIIDALLIFLIVSLLAVTIAYRIDLSDSGFNRFFNSETFGTRFILSTAASFITLGIQSIEQEVRVKAPYRRLARRYGAASNTILRNVNGTALTNLFSCLRHRDWFGFFAASTAVLGNVLIIAVAGIPYSSAAILPAFHASVYCTAIICVLMLIVVVWAFVWRRQNYKLRVPCEPNDVLIRVLMGLCNDDNRVRVMFDALDDTSDRGLRRHCRNYDRRYWAGWIMDVNGRVRWCVEREGQASLVG